MLCKKCHVEMEDSVALEQQFQPGIPDFLKGGNQDDNRGQTMVRSGEAKLIPCKKCPICGWSHQ